MLGITTSLLAGLGLFFVGLQLLTENLKALSGRQLREKIAAWTRHPLAGFAWGGVFIVITQSAAATAFVLIGMLRAGMVGVKQVLPILLGANCLAGFIFMILICDIRAGVFLLLGITGFLYSRERAGRAGAAAGAGFGAGLLFLGLDITRTGIAPLADMPWFAATIEATQGSYLLGLAAGVVLTLVTQSSLAIMALTLAFLDAGLFSMEQSVMIAYGVKVGSSVFTYLLSARLVGEARQIAMFQVHFNTLGALILVPAFYIEVYTGAPLMIAFGETMADGAALQLTIINLMFNVVPGIVVFPLVPWVTRLLADRYPATTEEGLAKPKYLLEQSSDDPHSAMRLIELEQVRLIDVLSHSFEVLGEGAHAARMSLLREGFDSLAESIRGAIGDLAAHRQMLPSVSARLAHLVSIQHGLETANSEVQSLSGELDVLRGSGIGERFSMVAVHGIGAIVMTLKDVARDRGDVDADLLARMTSEDGMERVRKAYLGEDEAMDTTARLHLLAALNHCERIIWSIGELGSMYRQLGSL